MDRNGYKRHTHRGKYFFRAFLLYLFLVVPVTLQAASFSVNSLLANVNSAASGFWCGTLNFITVPLGFCREVEPTVVISPNETQTDEAQELITLSSSSPDSPNISTTTFATTTSIVISETPTYITNEYITNEYITNPTTIIREIVKETVRAGDKSSSLNTSKFVTRDLLYGQADAIYDSQSNSFANIAESFTTDLLAVSGNATVSGTLTVTGDLTSSGLITGSLRPIDDIDMSGYILTNIGNIGTAFTSSGGLNLAGNLGVNGLSYTWPMSHGDGVLSNDGAGALAWQTLGAASITSDSLDFSEFKDALTLDASTDIAITGSNVFSLTNTGTGLSFRVNDEAGDTTPFVIDGMGKVGIGTTTPSGTLTIQGTAGTNPFTVASSTGSSLLTLTSSGRLVFGTSTTANIFLNGSSSSTPVANSSSIAIGNEALTFTSTSSAFLRNIALGYQALYGSSTNLMTGSSNFAVGYQSLYSNTTGSNNNAFGVFSLYSNTTGLNNNALGQQSLYSNTTGSYNNALGNSPLYFNTTGSNNNALGYQSLFFNTTGSNNNALGYQSLLFNTTGSNNTAIGNRAGFNHTTGTSTTYLGAFTNTTNGAVSSSTAIGAGALLSVSNSMVLGGTGANAVDIVTGTSIPWAKFSIMNNFGATSALFDIATTTSAGFATSSLFRVNANGNVGISTSTPSSLLTVAGTVGFSGLTASVGAGSLCLSANNEVVYNSGSDACLPSLRETKHDIKTLDITGLDLVSALESVSFVYNQSDGRTRYGFIAEDVASIDALLATYDANGNISGIDDRSMIAVIIKAVQELYQSVKELKGTLATVLERLSGQDAQVAALEARILMLESALDIESELAEEGESDTSVIPNNPTSDDQATSSDPVEPEPAPEPELDTEIEPESDTQSEPEPTPPNEEPEPTSVPAITE